MSIIDSSEELVSDVDLQAEFDKNGLRFSVFIDDVEFHESVDYDDMAFGMVNDAEKYPDEIIIRIAKGLRMMSDILQDGVDARGE
jgi:hypothetical protein